MPGSMSVCTEFGKTIISLNYNVRHMFPYDTKAPHEFNQFSGKILSLMLFEVVLGKNKFDC